MVTENTFQPLSVGVYTIKYVAHDMNGNQLVNELEINVKVV